MAQLYTDENFDQRVVEELRRFGHHVLTARDAGNAGRGIPDLAVLTFAIAQRRTVLTFNRRHFIKLHRQVRPHAGIIVCTNDPDFVALAGRIHQALQNCPMLVNQLVRVVRPPTP